MWNGQVNFHGEIGIEIETESKRGYDIPNDVYTYWNVQEDGSLRDVGREFVFRQPYDFGSDNYKRALASFEGLTKTVKFQKSVYSSVHVHFNQVDRTLTQIANFICLYLLCEEVLTRYCGPDRDGNLFCLKVSNAESTWQTVRNTFDAIENWHKRAFNSPKSILQNLREDNLKYSSINVAPLRSIGSIEIRTHGGTTDVVDIDRWVGILYQLYDAAKRFKSPIEILKLFKYWEVKRIYNKLFGKYVEYLDLTNLEKDTKAALYYVGTIASSVKDWSKLGVVEKKKEPVKTKLKVGKRAPRETDTWAITDEIAVAPGTVTEVNMNAAPPALDNEYYTRLLNEMARGTITPTPTRPRTLTR